MRGFRGRDHGRRCEDLLTQHIARIRRPRSGVKRWLKGEEREMTEIPLTGFVPATGMPTDATAFTPAMLNEMIAPWHPDIRITRIRILENKAYGDGMVSTARSEEHTSELQSLMRISYAVFCLKKQQYQTTQKHK